MAIEVFQLVKRSATYKLVIPIEVEKKIRHLCNRISDVEWSGTLFYTCEGSMEGGDLIIVCRDIYVMDIGTRTYTEFDMSPEVISYMCDHPELLDMQMGLIHSHNKMSTFFSGTDTATLKEEGRDRNHFVSLIVNNAGNYTAAITRKIKQKRTIHENYSYPTFGDVLIENSKDYEVEEEVIEYFGLDITKVEVKSSFEELDKRIDEIKKAKESKSTPTVGTYMPTPSKGAKMLPYEVGKKEKNLFSEIEDTDSEPPRNIPMEKEDSTDVTLDIDKDSVYHVLLQLLTGSIIIKNSTDLDVNKWVNAMPQTFGERFGVDEKGMKEYETWAESFCEFLVFGEEPNDIMLGEEEAVWLSDFAIALYKELEDLPSNRYIDILKEITEQWMTI